MISIMQIWTCCVVYCLARIGIDWFTGTTVGTAMAVWTTAGYAMSLTFTGWLNGRSAE